MPELAAMPYQAGRKGDSRIVRLVSVQGETDLSIELQSGINRIGRQRTDNHIVLVSPQISRFHAEIDVRKNEIIVRDLGSANGTFVNGARIEREVARPGDLIGFSDQFNLRLLIDVEIEEAGAITLSKSGPGGDLPQTEPAKPPPLLTIDSVPHSLEQRSRELEVTAPPEKKPSPTKIQPRTPTPLTKKKRATQPSRQERKALLEQQRQQMATLYQISKRCMSAESLEELDALLLTVLERTIALQKAFVTYQLPSRDWKLIMSPRGEMWDRRTVRELLHRAMKLKKPMVIEDSRSDPSLGAPKTGHDQRLLMPLRTESSTIGSIFVIAKAKDALTPLTVDFLALFADIAALAIVNCGLATR